MREDEERSKSINNFEFLVHSVLSFGINYTKNLKLKDIVVLLHFNFRPLKLKGTPNKLKLVEAVT